MREDYDEVVAEYYDEEANTFEQRAEENHVLMWLRDEFREITLSFKPRQMLEIGYGPGLDMTWFADREETEIVHGVDISPEFHEIVKGKALKRNDSKVIPHIGSAEDIVSVIGERGVDTVFVYFGALNTSKDLKKVAAGISQVLEPGGVAILTFVNRWYLFDILWNALLLRPRKSLARLGEIWTGYSPTRSLPSRCYSAREIRRSFQPYLDLAEQRGYCILHPAWYRKHWAPKGSIRSRLLRRIDYFLQWTPFWNFGEYSLYVFENPNMDAK